MRCFRYGVMIFCSIHAVVAFGGGADVTIVLKDTASIAREQLTLADVAHVQADSEWRARLERTGLGPAPRPGLVRRFDRTTLAELVRRQHGRSLSATWRGASAVTIQRLGIEYPADAFVTPARERLLAHLRERYPELVRIEAVPTGSPKPMRLPEGPLRLSARQIRSDTLAKRMCVWVDASVNGVAAGSMPVWFAVSAYRPTFVSAHEVTRHQVIGAADIRIEERDVAGLSAEPLAVGSALDRLRPRHALASGRVLLLSDVETRPSVLRDQEIQVRVQSGGVVIDTLGVALQEGHIGDRVSVRNPDSRKTYLARVVAEGAVMVAAK